GRATPHQARARRSRQKAQHRKKLQALVQDNSMMSCLVPTGLVYIFNRSKDRFDGSVPRKNVVTFAIVRSLNIANLPMAALRKAIIFAVALLSSSSVPVEAQSASASLTGRITDSSKAIVPNA